MTFSHLKARPAIAPSLSIPMASAFVSWQRTGYSGWVDAIWTFAVGLVGVGRALADCQRGCAPTAIAGGGIGCNPGAAARALRRHALGRN
jgi:steroid 5-alpha reductase family enzyme